MNDVFDRLSTIDPSERVLLLSHCLRPSLACTGKVDRKGLHCPESCHEDCVVGRLREVALSVGYKGVCIAPGGALAIRFVQETRPRAIVAVACERELAEGVEAVGKLAQGDVEVPVIAVVPLLRDGCVDTEVDEEQAMLAIAAGCYSCPLEACTHAA